SYYTSYPQVLRIHVGLDFAGLCVTTNCRTRVSELVWRRDGAVLCQFSRMFRVDFPLWAKDIQFLTQTVHLLLVNHEPRLLPEHVGQLPIPICISIIPPSSPDNHPHKQKNDTKNEFFTYRILFVISLVMLMTQTKGAI
ncbi:hypothetical protein SAMN05421543_1664, partial [Alicyclobacillus macrosporangiidus]